ncbi:MAG: helix-turn-helix domain-containing protein [Clostridiaceae bacterium]|nr:helix-turn-helix domain-containing protein [Clostridiaceae bacterium]
MTVKELADVCRVHYNTMRKWLADNKIKKADKAVNSPYLITDDVVNKAKKHFLNEDLKSEEKEEKIDSILIQQLTQKDKQIVKQQEQIEHLQRLLENQQILTLKAQEKVQLLESKEEINEEPKEENKRWRFFKCFS